MSSEDKKRSAAELSGTDSDLWKEIRLLKNEIEHLKSKLVDYGELKAKLAAYENDSSDEDDADSVCDGTSFSKNYFLLKQYKQEHGDCKVPKKHKQLAIWVMNTRASFKKKQLAQDRVDKLNKIGFYWGKDYPEPPSWDDRFQQLKKYHETFGHCNIPVNADPALMTDLAKWVVEQRKQGKRLQKMEPSEMTLDQYKLLDAMNFNWKTAKARRA